MNTVIKLPWIDDDEYLDFLQSCQKFQFFSKKYQNHPLIENFSKSKAVLLIYCSNKLENTLPSGTKQRDTHQLLCDILHDIDANINYTTTTWDADGGGDYSKIQMLQHMYAYKYLMDNLNEKLDTNIILNTHRILMKGAVDKYNVLVLNGEYRTFGVNNNIDNYLHFSEVKSTLEKTIDRYNCMTQSLSSDPIQMAHDLFWEFLVVHPFQDGNGRLGRLLVTYALMQHGIPFPVTISSGKKKSRKHYDDAIKKYSLLFSNNSALYTLIAYSVYCGWKKFINNVKVCAFPTC